MSSPAGWRTAGDPGTEMRRAAFAIALRRTSLAAQLGPRHAAAVGAVRIADVNRDGFPDALLKFRARETGIRAGHRAVLKGETFAGQRFFGVDRWCKKRGDRFEICPRPFDYAFAAALRLATSSITSSATFFGTGS